MPGFSVDHNGTSQQIMYADNVDFSGGDNNTVQERVIANGQLLIGASTSPKIRVNTLTAGAGITITNGAGTITIASDILTTNVIVTSAQLKMLSTVPAQLLAPPGPNLSYQILQVACYVDFATTPYTNANAADLYFIYGSSAGANLSCGFFGSGNGVTGTGLLDTSGDSFLGMSNMGNDARGMPVADIVNREITLINNAGLDLASGDSDLHLQILYRLVTTPF